MLMPLFLAFVFLTFVFRTVLFSLAVFLPFLSAFSESGTASSTLWKTEETFGLSGRRTGNMSYPPGPASSLTCSKGRKYCCPFPLEVNS